MGSAEVIPLPFSLPEKRTEPTYVSHTEQFEKVFPAYLAMGMTYKQFWNGDCFLVRDYKKAHQLKIQEQNTMLWLQGKYFYDALGAIAPVMNAFAKTGTKAEKYISRPYPITEEERKSEEERQAKVKRDAFKAQFMAFADQWERQNTKGGEQP